MRCSLPHWMPSGIAANLRHFFASSRREAVTAMEFRRTKIICTVGPATHSFDMLERMHAAGMNVVRINMSHADHQSAAEIIRWIKTLNRKVKQPVAVMLDSQGPEIRT